MSVSCVAVLVKLCQPYPREVVEPHDYQEATEVSAIVMDTVELSSTHSLAVSPKPHPLSLLTDEPIIPPVDQLQGRFSYEARVS